jgi:hypothetical protein
MKGKEEQRYPRTDSGQNGREMNEMKRNELQSIEFNSN